MIGGEWSLRQMRKLRHYGDSRCIESLGRQEDGKNLPRIGED